MERMEDLTENLLIAYWNAKQVLILEFIEHAYELLVYMNITDDEEVVKEASRNLRNTIKRCAAQLRVAEKVFGEEFTKDLWERFEELLRDIEEMDKIIAKRFPDRAEELITSRLWNNTFNYGVGGG